jgi:hypothetical protein
LGGPISKLPNTKQGWQSGSSGRVTSKCKDLSSSPSTTGKKKKSSEGRVSKYHLKFFTSFYLFVLTISDIFTFIDSLVAPRFISLIQTFMSLPILLALSRIYLGDGWMGER